MKTLIVLDMTFTLKMFRERQLEQALESLKLGGYFDRVISVHPLAGLFELGDGRFGEPVITKLDESLVFVEGKIGISKIWRFMPPLNFLLAQIMLLRLLLGMSRVSKVDVIRIGDPYYLGLMGLFLARLMRAPLAIRVGFRYDEIFRVTGKPVNSRLFFFRWVEKAVERFVFSRCDLIAGANEDNMRYALENGGHSNVATIFRYGNLIHPNHWLNPHARESADEILAEYGLLDEKFVITVARLEPMKYVEDAIRVVAELVRRGHSVKGLIVGNGSLRKELKSLATILGVGNAVIFAGNHKQEWLARVLPRATIIVSPHMGRALTEAALAGVPIVAYDYDWQREVVVDGQTGYLVPHKDWMGLSDKAECLLIHTPRGKRMGENAREKILEMMNPERLECHEQNEYSKMLKRFSMKHSSYNTH
jgi:glycosyltransferase involved in cell wall biosynthesis